MARAKAKAVGPRREPTTLMLEGKDAEALLKHRVGHKVKLEVQGSIEAKRESQPDEWDKTGKHVTVKVERVRHREGLPSPKSRPKPHHSQM